MSKSRPTLNSELLSTAQLVNALNAFNARELANKDEHDAIGTIAIGLAALIIAAGTLYKGYSSIGWIIAEGLIGSVSIAGGLSYLQRAHEDAVRADRIINNFNDSRGQRHSDVSLPQLNSSSDRSDSEVALESTAPRRTR